MRNAETVLGVLRERGRRHWPLERVYRLLFNPELYLLAYGRIYSNKGAMTPGVTGETADGMSMGKIEHIIDALRYERYRFSPVRRVYIPAGDAIPHCGTWLKPEPGQPGLSREISPIASGVSIMMSWSGFSRRTFTITGSSGLCVTCFRLDTWKTGYGTP